MVGIEENEGEDTEGLVCEILNAMESCENPSNSMQCIVLVKKESLTNMNPVPTAMSLVDHTIVR